MNDPQCNEWTDYHEHEICQGGGVAACGRKTQALVNRLGPFYAWISQSLKDYAENHPNGPTLDDGSLDMTAYDTSEPDINNRIDLWGRDENGVLLQPLPAEQSDYKFFIPPPDSWENLPEDYWNLTSMDYLKLLNLLSHKRTGHFIKHYDTSGDSHYNDFNANMKSFCNHPHIFVL